MRIVLSCLQSATRHAIPAYAFWRNYFVRGIREAGHEVVEIPGVDWAEGLTYPRGAALDRWRARTWNTVDDFVRREHAQKPINLFLSYFYPQQVEETAIRELQRLGIPCVNYFCDNIREFTAVPAAFKPFALHWVPEFEALPMYRRAGLMHIHAAMPCWVPPHLRNVPCVELEPPTFIGSADDLRRDLLGRALQAGADFVIRGVGWKARGHSPNKSLHLRSVRRVLINQIELARQHGWSAVMRKMENRLRPLQSPTIADTNLDDAVSDDEYLRVTRESIVTIGVNRVPTPARSPHRPLVYSRLRDIEAPMLAACYLTEWTVGLEHLYDLGSEIETYRSPEELSGKLDTLRRDASRRAAMRRRAQRRALADHCVTRSIARIGGYLGLQTL
jgi:hypothetical protein